MTASNNSAIIAVPTNVITGFLGTGKTTAILQLLKSKPEHERWAVLVNEFGEIGVDGSLFEGYNAKQQGIFVREVPGGCMCCAAGLPMQIALNQLLAEATPDRLLIEPTGLGHPKEVMNVLSSGYYRKVIDIQKIITLVDARHLQHQQYVQHDTFNQQITLADVLVGNKQDLYSDQDEKALIAYAALRANADTQVKFTQQGQLSAQWLLGQSQFQTSEKTPHHHQHNNKPDLANIAIPNTGYVEANNSGEGFESVGWRFSPEQRFNRVKLKQFIQQVNAVRLKAVFITQEGIWGFNVTTDGITEVELDECRESRIEIIARQIDPKWKSSLLACRENN